MRDVKKRMVMQKVDRRRKGSRTDVAKMLENTTLCKSQVNGEMYDKLKVDRQLNRFIATIQLCSTKGYDIKSTVELLIVSFPHYIVEKEFSVEVFKSMLETYGDIGIAWGYGKLGDDVSNTMIKNRAIDLAMTSDTIEDIAIYNDIYNVMKDAKEEEIVDSESKGTTINFNLTTSNKSRAIRGK